MLEALLELVAYVLFEPILPMLVELGLELGWESLRHAAGRGRAANPLLATFGLLILGAGIGFASAALVPQRVWRPILHPSGVSVVLAPFLNGALMQAFGGWRRSRGGDPSALATWWGGAVFAFAVAITRWWLVAAR